MTDVENPEYPNLEQAAASELATSDSGTENEAIAHDHGGHEGHHTSLGLSNMKLAMWLFLGSECLLFGALISTYLLSKTRFLTELLAGNPIVTSSIDNEELVAEMVAEGSVEPLFDIPFTSFSSFVLLMSSLAMVLAHHAVVNNDIKGSRIWLGATAVMGSIFIGGQIYEFTTFYNEGLTFDGSLLGSALYTLTGFHGVHVSGGILMLMSLLFVSFKGRLTSDRAETVELVGLYWHFVDVVWVLIFTIVYLIP